LWCSHTGDHPHEEYSQFWLEEESRNWIFQKFTQKKQKKCSSTLELYTTKLPNHY
jgi:hypothetical protein